MLELLGLLSFVGAVVFILYIEVREHLTDEDITETFYAICSVIVFIMIFYIVWHL